MSVADRLNKLSTDITNAYTSINNKGGTIPANKNTDNLHTAIDSIQSSNIIGATAEGESLSLANTKAMPYSDYIVEGKSEQNGEPSPSNPSEIHSVADDVNLFDASKIANSSISVTDNGKTIIMPLFTSGGGYTSTNTKLSVICPDLKVGDIAFLHFIKNISGSYNNYIYLVGSNRAWQKDSYATITQSDLDSTVIMYANDYGHGETEQLIITDFKIQKGTTATPYSPYNQGTVTTKQRGKNLWNEELENAEYDNNGNKQDATIWLVNKNKINVNPNTTYTISQQQTPSQYRIICFNNNTFLEWISSVQDITTGYKNYTFTTPANCNKIYIQFRSIIEKIAQGNYNMIPSDITNIQLEQGSTATSYEPYQANDYTIQTEPLRSLPNGVKDTIEAEQHRKIGRQTGTLTETTTITLSDAKTNGAYICNIKPSGTLTGKTIELEAGDYEIIYELAEETIEPLTQNQATTMLDIIKTGSYEGTTNIYTDEDVKPTIGVDYYKYGETGGLPTVENEKLIFDKELQIDREELIF